MKTFIYGLYSESDSIIRYIGKSDDPKHRLKRHIYQRNDSNTHKNNWIKKLLENNEKLNYKIIEEVDYEKWQEKEKYWISQFENLTNTATGGIGGCSIKYKISYNDCKEWIRNNLKNINSKNKWYEKLKNLPDFIPSNPREVYKKKGWVSWGDFLGTKKVQDNFLASKYLSYNDAKIWIVENKIEIVNCKSWKDINTNGLISKRPERFYKNKGWVSWSDFLSNGRIQNQKKCFLNYNDCILWLINNNYKIDKCKDWEKIRRDLPNFIPSSPNVQYKNSGWSNWETFFKLINV